MLTGVKKGDPEILIEEYPIVREQRVIRQHERTLVILTLSLRFTGQRDIINESFSEKEVTQWLPTSSF